MSFVVEPVKSLEIDFFFRQKILEYFVDYILLVPKFLTFLLGGSHDQIRVSVVSPDFMSRQKEFLICFDLCEDFLSDCVNKLQI